MQWQWNRRKNYLRIGWTSIWLIVCTSVQAQHKWDGEGRDGQWMNPLNWNVNTIPGNADEVVLDNSMISGSYMVMLPAGAITIIIKRLTIDPSASDSITLILPKENIAVPGLQISSTGYALTLKDRSVFINASGASAGLPVMISDSIRINDGARYIHRTGRSHVANVMVLATAPGTESGIFEFDSPDASGTISLSDRIYGTLILSAVAAGRTVNYTAAGTRRIRVRSDLILNPKVVLNLNFSDTFFIERNFIQYASTFNCGTTARSLTILIQGNLQQYSGGIITETGTGLPALLMRSSGRQHLLTQGSIVNSIAMIIESADCWLESSVRLPYTLKLITGRIHTTDSTLLILSAAATLETDSLTVNCFVDGPLLKEGLQNEHFLFPVGKQVTRRWLTLRNVTGNVRVEFIKSNPQLIGQVLGVGLHHISSIEYWKVSEHQLTGGTIELSFDNVNSGGVTELSSLRVATFEGGKWENAGNSFTTGNAGGSGSVVSNSIGVSGTGDRYFTLAASTGFQNPLPFVDITLHATNENGYTLLKWTIMPGQVVQFFEIEGSSDGLTFNTIGTVVKRQGNFIYSFKVYNQKHLYFRLRAIVTPNESHLSTIIYVRGRETFFFTLQPTIVRDQLIIKFETNPPDRKIEVWIVSLSGVIKQKLFISNDRNNGIYYINTGNLAAGVYYLVINRKTLKFVRL